MITDHVWPQSEGEPAKVDPCTRSFSLKLGSYIPVSSYAMRYVQCTLCSGEKTERRNWRFHPLIPWTPSPPSSDWASGKSVWRLTKIGGIKIIERKWNLVKRKSRNLHNSSWYKKKKKYGCAFYISKTDKIETPFQKKYCDTRGRIWTKWVIKNGKWSSIGRTFKDKWEGPMTGQMKMVWGTKDCSRQYQCGQTVSNNRMVHRASITDTSV